LKIVTKITVKGKKYDLEIYPDGRRLRCEAPGVPSLFCYGKTVDEVKKRAIKIIQEAK